MSARFPRVLFSHGQCSARHTSVGTLRNDKRSRGYKINQKVHVLRRHVSENTMRVVTFIFNNNY